jgi:threonine/homoserine/homoserine lactone efflux protein
MLLFLGVSLLVIVTPGQDTALTIRNSLLGDRQTGIATACGIASGQAAWTAATSVGVGALLVASEPAFVALRLAGAAYLVWLGAHALWSAARRSGVTAPRSARARRPRVAYRQGLLSNLGNPKMLVFFTSLLPQFSTTGAGLLAHGLVFCAMTLAWLTLYALAVTRARRFLERTRVRRAIDAVAGLALVGFGARLATERR